MTTITDKLEAALPANDDDNGPVTLPASVVREAVRATKETELWFTLANDRAIHKIDLQREVTHQSESADKWHRRYHEAQLQLSDQRNAKGLAWALAVIGAFIAGAVVL